MSAVRELLFGSICEDASDLRQDSIRFSSGSMMLSVHAQIRIGACPSGGSELLRPDGPSLCLRYFLYCASISM
jgi:hypothetical protein